MRSIFSAGGVFLFVVLVFSSGYGQESDEFEAAKLLNAPKVTVPNEAVESGLGGKITVRVLVDESGNVSSVENLNGPGHVCSSVSRTDVVAMRTAAKEAALSATFSPATRKGMPEKSSMSLNFDFPGDPNKTELSFTPTKKIPDYTVKGDRNYSAEKAPPPDYTGPVSTAGSGSFSASDTGNNPKRLSGGVLNGKAESLPKPPYPAAARAVRASGTVQIQVLIDEGGEVFTAEAVSGHPLLRAASKIAACGARFSPTRLEGNPVKVSGIITYNFVP